ncbi:MAG: hypothetical protein M1829_004377 [Trizodia sp. TS-e1964]|nr:MAG: hypothetical protein M1829_004377 [Trizodia sp. TS-e1964]
MPRSDTEEFESPTADGWPEQQSSHPLAVDLDTLPRPHPLIALFSGWSTEKVQGRAHLRISKTESAIGRDLTNDEVRSLYQWTATGLSIAAWGYPLGVTAGLLRAYQTTPLMKFPCLSPKLSQRVLANFRSTRRGFLAVQFARYLSYYTIGASVGRFIMSSYATSIALVGQQRDPVLRDMNDELVAAVRVGRPKRPVRLPARSRESSRPEISEMESPTARYGDFADQERPQDETQPDEKSSRGGWRQRMAGKAPRSARPHQTPRQTDDASPTDGFPPLLDDDWQSAQTPQTEGSQKSGSAWNRIRDESSTSSRPSSSGPTWKNIRSHPKPASKDAWSKRRAGNEQEQRDGPDPEDSFTFASSDEERQVAKEEAQRAFDAKVERERQGGDFSENGKKRGKGW